MQKIEVNKRNTMGKMTGGDRMGAEKTGVKEMVRGMEVEELGGVGIVGRRWYKNSYLNHSLLANLLAT